MAIFIIDKKLRELLADCIEIGLEGAAQNSDNTEESLNAVAAILEEIQASDADATELTIVPFVDEDLNTDQGGPADCAIGLHSWVNEEGKLPASTPCDRCGEPYGDPS